MEAENMHFETKILDSRLASLPLIAQTRGAAGLDLRACLNRQMTVGPEEVHKIPTGLAVYIKDPGLMGLVILRSSVALGGLELANGVGLVDSDYQGEIMLLVRNPTSYPIRVNPLDRLAQLVITPCIAFRAAVVNEFSEVTERGTGGLGSTGAK